jgi:NitT/TauT family transport system substrate-binding protein
MQVAAWYKYRTMHHLSVPSRAIPLAFAFLLAACGGAASPSAPASSPAAASPAAAASSAAAKPAVASVAASAPASAKPAASASGGAAASAKPAAGASGGAAASAAAKPAASGGKITSFYSTVSPTFAPLWIAKEAGIFQKNGLDVDVQLLQNPQGTAALLANQVQLGLSGSADMLGPVTSGADLQALATFTNTYPYVFEVADNIKTPADLKGKKIGASQAGGSDYVALLSVLGKLNLDSQKDVNILFVGGIPQRTAALLGGNVVGTLTAPPETLQIEGKGYHSLIDVTSLNLPSATSTLTSHKAWIQANHATVQKFVDSLMEAAAREKADKAYAEQVMSKYLKQDDKQLLDISYDYAVKLTRDDLLLSPEIVQAVIEQAGYTGHQASEFMDMSVPQELNDNGFIKSLANSK